jgi:hypothetical protein
VVVPAMRLCEPKQLLQFCFVSSPAAAQAGVVGCAGVVCNQPLLSEAEKYPARLSTQKSG